MAEAQFPPPAKIPYSVRAQELEATRFLAIRKAASELYVNPDKSPLMTYGETLLDKPNVKKRVLEYELSNGWLEDDRASPQAQPQAVQPMAPAGATATAPAIGFVAPPVMQAPAPPVPVMTFNPAPMVPAAPPPVQAAPPPVAPEQTAPTPQPPPAETPMAMPTGRARRGRPAALGTAVAPPPPPPQATVLTAPQALMGGLTLVQPVATVPQVPVAPPAPMAPQMPVAAPSNTGVLEAKVDALAKTVAEFASIMSKQQSSASGDFNQVVANLSGQINETNKALKELGENMKALREAAEVSFVALHHLYLCSPMAAQAGDAGKNAQTFKEHLKQYVPR